MSGDRTDAEVLAAFDAMVEALCERRDGDAAARLFAEEDDAVMWGSGPDEVAVGYDAIGDLLRARAAADSKGFTFRWDIRTVRAEGDVAWVNAVGEWYEAGADPETGPYRVAAVLVRRAGAWRWHSFTGSEPSAA